MDGDECSVAVKYGGGTKTVEGSDGDGKPTHLVMTRRYDAYEEMSRFIDG